MEISNFGPNDLLQIYRRGIFPMAESFDDPQLLLIDPDIRGIIPINDFHIPKSLAKVALKQPYKITCNQAFRAVIEECSALNDNRTATWINRPIIQLYDALHRLGHAYSIEAWFDNKLVGGLYGVVIGGAFFGESMFSRMNDASKISLLHLAAALKKSGFMLLDAQFPNPHLNQFGAYELKRKEFQKILAQAIKIDAIFPANEFMPRNNEGLISGSNEALLFPLSSGSHCLSMLQP